MKNFFLSVAFLLMFSSSAQSIQVFSVKDSLGVSFASLWISNDSFKYNKTATDAGLIILQEELPDSVKYKVSISCFGFEKFEKDMYGYELKRTREIFITPSDINLNEIVITAQYEPTVAEKAVQKIRIIDGEKIRQMAAVNLRDVLNNQLNVRIQQDNILGSGLSVQGLSGQNVKILVDGVPVIGRLDGNIDLSQINMNNVERIEFIEGPLSVQYGTNALAGTINIITKKSNPKKIDLGITSYYESIGTYNFAGDFSYTNKKHALQFNSGRNYFDGWNSTEGDFYFPKVRIADSARFKQWKPKEQYFVTLAYQYNLRRLSLGIKSAYFDEVITNKGYPMGIYGENAYDDKYYTKRIDNSVSLTGKLSAHWSVNTLSAYNYYSRIKRTVYKDLTTLQEELSRNSSDQDTSGFSLFMNRGSFIHKKPDSKINYELGYDLNYESALGKRIENGLKYIGDYAAFATLEYKFSRVIIKPGLRYAYNTSYNTPLVPSLNLKWALSDRHSFRASYARGFRAPSLKELYFTFVDINHNIVGNTALLAEKSDNYSFSYNYLRSAGKCRITLDATIFYNSVFNLITLQQTTSTEYSYINSDIFKSYGLQLGSNLNFKRLSFRAGFNYTGRYNQLASEPGIPQFNYSPEAQLNVIYKWLKPKISVAIFYKYNGELPGYVASESGEITQTLTRDYAILDATLSKLIWKERINLSLGCKNLFDVQNISRVGTVGGVHNGTSSSVPLATGRNYFIRLAINFSKL